jgi:hypothetical protein
LATFPLSSKTSLCLSNAIRNNKTLKSIGTEVRALLIGAGAVENAWLPITRALQPGFKHKVTAEGASTILANLVYQLRWYSGHPDQKFVQKRLDTLKDYISEVRSNICRELLASEKSGEIRARPVLFDIVKKFLLPNCKQFMVVSTNWDTVVDEALMNSKLFETSIGGFSFKVAHLHGSVLDSKTIYLPTEVTQEPYRSKDEEEEIGTLHGSIMRALELSHSVILFGLSLSPLDAELTQTISSGWDSKKLRMIKIIDPNHEIVADRIKVLLRQTVKISIQGFDPARLDKPVHYFTKS